MTGIKGKRLRPLCAAVLALLLCGCSATAGTPAQSAEASQPALTLTAAFQREDGTALTDDTVRFSLGGDSADYVPDEHGELVLSDLPRKGELTVTVLDRQTQPQGSITLSFSQGSVIDAAADGDGTGHITLKEDTEELALDFTLLDDGSLQCALRLGPPRTV